MANAQLSALLEASRAAYERLTETERDPRDDAMTAEALRAAIGEIEGCICGVGDDTTCRDNGCDPKCMRCN